MNYFDYFPHFKNPSKIGFGGDSYIEYDRTDLRDTSSIAFTFRTKQADALILLATGQDYMVRKSKCLTGFHKKLFLYKIL